MKRKLVALVFLMTGTAWATPYNFETASGQNVWVEVDAWAGSGANESILVVDWNFMGGPYSTESHAFGFRWNSTVTLAEMLGVFDNLGVLTLSTGSGGYLSNIIYDDGTDVHNHSEPGSWNTASSPDPFARWGTWGDSEWIFNMGISERVLEHGHFEGINAFLWFGQYPEGQSSLDYPLNIPFATPEPGTLFLTGMGAAVLLRNRKR